MRVCLKNVFRLISIFFVKHISFRVRNLHGKVMLLAPETNRLEILHKSELDPFVYIVTTIKDDIFVVCGHCHNNGRRPTTFDIRVYSSNNMADVQDIIAPPGKLRSRQLATFLPLCAG